MSTTTSERAWQRLWRQTICSASRSLNNVWQVQYFGVMPDVVRRRYSNLLVSNLVEFCLEKELATDKDEVWMYLLTTYGFQAWSISNRNRDGSLWNNLTRILDLALDTTHAMIKSPSCPSRPPEGEWFQALTEHLARDLQQQLRLFSSGTTIRRTAAAIPSTSGRHQPYSITTTSTTITHGMHPSSSCLQRHYQDQTLLHPKCALALEAEQRMTKRKQMTRQDDHYDLR